MTEGKTKTIDYTYYAEFLQEMLNRYLNFSEQNMKDDRITATKTDLAIDLMESWFCIWDDLANPKTGPNLVPNPLVCKGALAEKIHQIYKKSRI